MLVADHVAEAVGLGGDAPAIGPGCTALFPGAGVAGMGWSIGVPYLERMTRYGLPRYTRSDRIASGGAGELVHTGNGVYRAREEGGFVRFTWVEGATDHWVAEYPDGRRAYFGATELGARDNTARISVTGAGEEGSASGTYRWCVTAETDRLGH
ncbi:MAG: SpvB/TcaC N-terminal domain-containing protein, partial [Myxococcota bacterium]